MAGPLLSTVVVFLSLAPFWMPCSSAPRSFDDEAIFCIVTAGGGGAPGGGGGGGPDCAWREQSAPSRERKKRREEKKKKKKKEERNTGKRSDARGDTRPSTSVACSRCDAPGRVAHCRGSPLLQAVQRSDRVRTGAQERSRRPSRESQVLWHCNSQNLDMSIVHPDSFTINFYRVTKSAGTFANPFPWPASPALSFRPPNHGRGDFDPYVMPA